MSMRVTVLLDVIETTVFLFFVLSLMTFHDGPRGNVWKALITNAMIVFVCWSTLCAKRSIFDRSAYLAKCVVYEDVEPRSARVVFRLSSFKDVFKSIIKEVYVFFMLFQANSGQPRKHMHDIY